MPGWLCALLIVGCLGGLLSLVVLVVALVAFVGFAFARDHADRLEDARFSDEGSWEVRDDGSWVAGPCDFEGCMWPRGHRRTDHLVQWADGEVTHVP